MADSSRTLVPLPGTVSRLAPPKWLYIYVLLAGFFLVAVSVGLYLMYRIVNIYTASVEINQRWAERVAGYSHLGELAGKVNAPGNDVFDTHDVEAESARLRVAANVFALKMAQYREELGTAQDPLVTAPLLADLDEASAAMKAMVEEAELIFGHLRNRRPDLAGERMATMDRRYAQVIGALAHLRGSVGEIQKWNFDRQTAAVASLQGYEYVIGVLILLMVAGATIYGRQLARKMQADAEDRHRHFTSLGQAEARTRAILGTAAESIVAFDETGRIETFNEAAERMFGYADGEALGKDIQSIIPALWECSRLPATDGNADSAAGALHVQATEAMARRRNGAVFPIALSLNQVGVGNKTLYTGIVRDISDRRQTEEALRLAAKAEAANVVLQRNERRLQLLKDLSEHCGAATSVEEVLAYGLTALCDFAGWPLAHAWVPAGSDRALVSTGLWFFDDEARYAPFRAVTEASQFGAEAGGLIGRVVARGQPEWVADVAKEPRPTRHQQAMIEAGLHAVCVFPLLFDQEVEGVFEFFAPEALVADPQFLEIVDQVGPLLGAAARRKRDAAELQKVAMIAQSTDQAVVITDAARNIEWVNPGFTAMTGYTLAEAVGRKPGDLLHGEETDREAMLRIRSALNAGQKVGAEVLNYTKSGRKFWMHLNIQPVFDHLGKVAKFIAIEQDISERREAEEKLRHKEEEIRSIVGSLVDAVISIDARGTVRSFNPSAERLFGYGPAEVIGRNVKMLMPEPAKSEHDGYLHNYERTGHARIIGIGREVEGRRKDGQSIPLDLAVSEYRIKGERYFTGILRDITERRRATAALTRARQEAEEANRAKSAFLAAMSHELRTPMNGVVGMIDVLTHTELDADQRDMVATVRESAFSLLGVIDDILDFSKIEAGKLDMERVPVSIAKVVEGVCETLAPIAHKKGVELLTFCDPRIPDGVLTDPVRLRQVLFNLAGNAVKFSGAAAGRAGKVTIRADLLELAGNEAAVCLQIADNGIGMTRETMDKLFQPFTQAESSTTRRFGGTGLGLSISMRLAQLMGGRIEVESEAGVGSTFRALFDFEAAGGVPVEAERQFDLRDLKVVVVAGGPMREILVTYLAHSGAQVLLGEEADEALLDAIGTEAAEGPFVIVVADTENDRALAARLRNKFVSMFHNVPPRFVMILRGRRRQARMAGPDSVEIDANAMRRAALLRAVAVAAGRASPEADAPENQAEAQPSRPPSIIEAEAAGQLILVAEDNKTNQKVIERQLHLLGYAVEFADDGREALSMWQSKRYGLVLTDCHMPEMDGFEFTAALRREENASDRHTPVVAVTANALMGEKERCLAAGMDDYMSKPTPLDVLRAILMKWLPIAAAAPEKRPPAAAPGEGGPPEGDAVDPEALKAIVGDDPAVLVELLDDFVVTARDALAGMDAAYRGSAAEGIAGLAHKLKSSARTVGAHRLADLCQELERAGKAGDWPAIEAAMPEMSPCFAAVERFIGAYTSQEAEGPNADADR